MKKFKKILALAIAMVMVLAMGSSVLADSTATHKITIKNEDQIGKHTYEAYQVFAGDYDETSGKLSNITWGTGVNSANILAAVKADTATFGTEAANAATAEDVAKLLGTGNDTEKAKKFAAIVGANLGSVAGTSTATGSPYEISVTGDGYYFVKDKAGSLPTDSDTVEPHAADAETRYILQVVHDVEVNSKSNTVESKKKVDDINDSTGAEEKLQDSADYEIGDTIPYTLTFTLPDNYADYTTYKVNFFDDMSKGLTYNNDAKIYYGASDETGAEITFAKVTTAPEGTSAYEGGTVYKAAIADLKTAKPGLAAGTVITIKYTATLNADAVVGSAGNPNKYQVECSNNPNGEGTGKTPWDVNIVFTYQANFDKVDENKAPLKGADFKLEKQMADGSWKDVTELHENGANPVKIGSSSDQSTTFSFKGLDDGVYRLTETYTPKGYNSIDPIEFTISASHDADSADPKLTNLEAKGLTMSADKAAGTLSTSIENKSGAVLPSTGGIGTRIFYVLGSIMVVGAGILLVTRRRMSAQ